MRCILQLGLKWLNSTLCKFVLHKVRAIFVIQTAAQWPHHSHHVSIHSHDTTNIVSVTAAIKHLNSVYEGTSCNYSGSFSSLNENTIVSSVAIDKSSHHLDM